MKAQNRIRLIDFDVIRFSTTFGTNAVPIATNCLNVLVIAIGPAQDWVVLGRRLCFVVVVVGDAMVRMSGFVVRVV